MVKPLRSTDRRALIVLAESPDGCPRITMLVRGFPRAVLNRLADAELASITREERGVKMIEIVRITDAGRQMVTKAEHGSMQTTRVRQNGHRIIDSD